MEEGSTCQLDRIKLNIGGVSFQCFSSTLKTFPGSKLANLNTHSFNYDSPNKEYFFDRNPWVFSFILDACRTGTLHLPHDICSQTIKEEMEFWEISPALISECCWKAYYKTEEEIQVIKKLTENYFQNRLQSGSNSLRMKLWCFLDNPNSSKMAMAWGIVVMVAVFLSTLITLSESFDAFREPLSAEGQQVHQKVQMFLGLANSTDADMKKFGTQQLSELIYLDAGNFVLITVDILLRIVSCPCAWEFFKKALNICEIVCVIDFWLVLGIEQNLGILTTQWSIVCYFFLKSLIILKVFRLFRLCKCFPALQVLNLSIRSSSSEIGMVSAILMILVILFGCLVYSAEFLVNDNFNDAFEALYWSLITLTTVGYGDLYPTTLQGQVIACACAVCGMIMLALPVGVIASNFQTFYSHHKYAEKHIRNHKIESIGEKKSCATSLTKYRLQIFKK